MGRPAAGAEREARLGLDATLSFLRVLWGLNHALDRRSKAMDRTLGVTGPQRLAVRLIGLAPGIHPSDLAELLCMHPSTLTGIVRRLVEAGFLAREVDPDDRRRVRLTLTPAGEGVDQATEGTVEAAVRTVLKSAGAAEVLGATTLLHAIRSALEGTEDRS